MKSLTRATTATALSASFAVALLTIVAIGGLWVRPVADDWCYQTNIRTMSIWQFVHYLYRDSNGRAGNAVLLGIVHSLGPLGLQLYPAALAALLLGSVWLLGARVWALAGASAPAAAHLLAAATVSLAFLLVCPQPYQTAYWASGGISHTVPPVLATGLVAAVLCLPRRGPARWIGPAALLLGFAFIALVSEAMALVACALAAGLWARVPAARPGALATVAGSAAGLLVEYLSPGMRARSTGLGVPHGAELLNRLGDGVVTWLGDLATTLTGWQYLAVPLAGAVLGLVTRGPAAPATGRLLLWATGAVLLASLLVTELVEAVFGSWIWYMVRTWNDWRLPYALLLCGAGVAAGRALASAARPRRLLAALLPLGAVALLGLTQPAYVLVHDTHARARHWDAQHASVDAQLRAGIADPTYIPSYIGRLRDAYTRSGHPDWVLSCIDDYYGAHVRLPAHSHDWQEQAPKAPLP